MSEQRSPLEDMVEQAVEAFILAPIGLWFEGPKAYDDLVRAGRNQVATARMMGKFAVDAGKAEVDKRAKEAESQFADLLRAVGMAPPQDGASASVAASSSHDTEPPTAEPAAATAPAETAAASKQAPAKRATKKAATKRPAAKKAPAKKAPAKKAPAKPSAAKKAAAKKAAAKKATKGASVPEAAETRGVATPNSPAPNSAALPITDYDSLSASQVVSRLRGLDTAGLDEVEAYEAATRARKTVLSKVTQLRSR